MNGRKKRTDLAFGVLLILLGGLFLAWQMVPGLRTYVSLDFAWPLIIVGVGLFLLVLGALTGAPGMAVPASIVGGIGALLYWQNATGNWASWAYAWALIPGFVGFGVLLSGLLGEGRKAVRDGAGLMVISAVLFLAFGSFLGGADILGPYWPVLLIGLGVVLLIAALIPRSS
jgi:hypothetical protein